jgi:hypothetical protein
VTGDPGIDCRRVDPHHLEAGLEQPLARATGGGADLAGPLPGFQCDAKRRDRLVELEPSPRHLVFGQREHLSIDTRDPEAALARIRHVGAAFLGPWSPVAAGDYAAGPSHVLPTGGTARFAAGLSANDFLRAGSVISLSQADLGEMADDIRLLADTEGLTAHRRSVTARL